MARAGRSAFRIVATSLLATDVAEADRIAQALKNEGWPHANRSLVVREALARLFDDLHGKSSEEIFLYFINRRGRRIPKVSKFPTAGGGAP